MILKLVHLTGGVYGYMIDFHTVQVYIFPLTSTSLVGIICSRKYDVRTTVFYLKFVSKTSKSRNLSSAGLYLTIIIVERMSVTLVESHNMGSGDTAGDQWCKFMFNAVFPGK